MSDAATITTLIDRLAGEVRRRERERCEHAARNKALRSEINDLAGQVSDLEQDLMIARRIMTAKQRVRFDAEAKEAREIPF